MTYLEAQDHLAKIKKEVVINHELAGVTKLFDGEKTCLFENVKHYEMPVISNVVFDRKSIADSVGVEVDKLIDKYLACMAEPLPCEYSQEKPAHKSCVQVGDAVNLLELPIPIHHEKDGGQYITAGLLIVKDVATGKQNVSIHRLQVFNEKEMGILILPRHLWHLFSQYEARGEALDIAICIGAAPALLLASQAITPYGVDELEIANAMLDNQLKLVKCETVNVDVPEHCEIVIEGKLVPSVRKVEGPFGEFPRYYGPAGDRPVINVTAICRREDAIYHTILPGTKEHLLLGGIAREASMLRTIAHTVPTVKAVHITFGSSCRYHAVVSIKKEHEGEGKNAILAAFSNSHEIKHVIVVDDDIDIFDADHVEWALATRFQAGEDLMLIKGSLGSKLDPSSDKGISDKIGLDATLRLDRDSNKFQVMRIPGLEQMKREDYL
ncbi:UbiD family decarboxylase [Fusibacter paucivorans]|uniref:UbiD family decarboxylase n=2 Tax=Fusibacter paucivorans TaxID=76009 RepID=A0ABS5PPB3_9FIRM|nr:UbiD family decarboxylase [Fusibacter paucivorans]